MARIGWFGSAAVIGSPWLNGGSQPEWDFKLEEAIALARRYII